MELPCNNAHAGHERLTIKNPSNLPPHPPSTPEAGGRTGAETSRVGELSLPLTSKETGPTPCLSNTVELALKVAQS